MNKKILIGSIIALCILIGISFTSVVGYRSVVSDVNVSPLFTIRSSRAIDEECREFSCDYVGNWDSINLLFPEKEKVSFQKIIDVVQSMDDETFNEFITLLLSQIQKEQQFNCKNLNQIKEAFYQFKYRGKPVLILNTMVPTDCCGPTVGTGVFHCILVLILLPFLLIAYRISEILWELGWTIDWGRC
jgi:hypothetical protein